MEEKTIPEMLELISDEICDKYCKYSEKYQEKYGKDEGIKKLREEHCHECVVWKLLY